MMIHDITKQAGRNKQRKRVGRGPGSGGKRSGRGQKGAGSRRGHSTRFQFEGGQMPFFRRLPKMGFSNENFATKFWVVNLGAIVKHESFAKGGKVNGESLVEAGLIRDTSRDVKILGDLKDQGDLKVKLEVEVNRISKRAKELVEGAGGSVSEIGTRRDRVRGIDRKSGDLTPKNLTKKLKRGSGAKSS